MPNLVSLGLMLSDKKKIYKNFQHVSVLLPRKPEFCQKSVFKELQKKAMSSSFLCSFDKIRWVVSDKMFEIKDNACTLGRTHARTDSRQAQGHNITMSKCITILGAYAKYRHLG